MKLSESTKKAIIKEFNEFRTKMYAGKSLKERKELDQFFTPAELTIQMVEKMNCNSLKGKTILDPTCGSGNLLMACLIAGAEPCDLYGNDYDGEMVNLCYDRLNGYSKKHFGKPVPKFHIHRGNAMQKVCLTEFGREYEAQYDYTQIDNIMYGQEGFFVSEKKKGGRRKTAA